MNERDIRQRSCQRILVGALLSSSHFIKDSSLKENTIQLIYGLKSNNKIFLIVNVEVNGLTKGLPVPDTILNSCSLKIYSMQMNKRKFKRSYTDKMFIYSLSL